MKRFTTEGTNDQEGRGLVSAQRREEEAPPLGLSFDGGEAGARTLSRRQALGLVGGCLAGVSLLSLGLATPAKAIQQPSGDFGIRGPRSYTIPQLRFVRGGNWYDLTLWWKCVFEPSVVNHTFETNWILFEEDYPPVNLNDGPIPCLVEPHVHSAYSPRKVFTPSQANPSNPQEVSFKETIIWHVDDLDTEIGNEEIYAVVRIGDNTTNSGLYTVHSSQLNLAP